MNLYSRKQRVKAVLLVVAVAIVAVSLWYSNFIVNKIKQEERQKVELWSQAVQKRLALIDYTRELFEQLRREERNKVRLWSMATERIPKADDDEMNLLLQITANNTTVPVIVTDEEGNVNFWRNINDSLVQDSTYIHDLLEEMRNSYPPLTVEVYEGTKQYVYYKDSRLLTELEQTLDDLINSFISETVMNSASVPVILTDSSMTEVIRFGNVDSSSISTTENLKERLSQMREANDPIPVELDNQQQAYIFYENSVILTQLRYYPYVQFLIVGLFLVIAYLIFSTFRNAEQNQVWIGMAKETAHQLGTPLSSLMAWIQLLQAKGVDDETIGELNKDVKRLETITDRFSKIGSQPELNVTDIKKVVDDALDYFRPRVSRKVEFEVVHNEQMQTKALINRPLFSWVLENLIKNSIDAMEGEGKISIEITNDIQHVLLDISDTGKGIPSGNQKAVFEPGYTTKKRGWGLGLSLTKRIIENYHEGKIFVKRSEPKKGTTFRIVLKTRARSNKRNGNQG